jgi:hypothetical protein
MPKIAVKVAVKVAHLKHLKVDYDTGARYARAARPGPASNRYGQGPAGKELAEREQRVQMLQGDGGPGKALDAGAATGDGMPWSRWCGGRARGA